MTEAVSSDIDGPAATPKARTEVQRSLFSGDGNGPLRLLGFLVVFASVMMSSVSFLILSGATNIEPSPEIWTVIWVVTGILVLLVLALVVTEAVLLLQGRMQRLPGSALQVRMVAMFALVAGIPAILVAIFANIALNQGLDQWLSDRTR